MGDNEQTPALPDETMILRAICDPGSFTKRGDYHGEPYGESVQHWSMRAVQHVITEWLAGRTVLELPAKARVVHLLPDNVVVIGNAHEASRAHKAMAEIKAMWPERRVVCFAGDIDVEVLRDGSLLASESSGDGETDGRR